MIERLARKASYNYPYVRPSR